MNYIRFHRDPAGIVWDQVTGLPTNVSKERIREVEKNREQARVNNNDR